VIEGTEEGNAPAPSKEIGIANVELDGDEETWATAESTSCGDQRLHNDDAPLIRAC